jgi:hypothetical protein
MQLDREIELVAGAFSSSAALPATISSPAAAIAP